MKIVPKLNRDERELLRRLMKIKPLYTFIFGLEDKALKKLIQLDLVIPHPTQIYCWGIKGA